VDAPPKGVVPAKAKAVAKEDSPQGSPAKRQHVDNNDQMAVGENPIANEVEGSPTKKKKSS
jgi:hypothetical protein